MDPKTYLPGLTGLRAFCAFAVIATHALPTLVPQGAIGVDLFFVLSGLLISNLLVTEYDRFKKLNLPRFYLRRWVRLWPALIVVCVGFGVFVAVRKHGDALWSEFGPMVPALLYFMNWTRAYNLMSDGAFGHTWSLAVEEQFYLVWPLVLMVILRLQGRARTISALTLAVLFAFVPALLWLEGATSVRIYNGFDSRAVALLAGCTLSLTPRRNPFWAFAGRTWAIPAVAIAGCALLHFEQTAATQAIQIPVIAALGAWLIAGIQTTPPRLLEWAPVKYLGTISYGIYLWHYPISLQLNYHIHNPALRMAAISGVAVAVAAVSYQFIEAPVRAMGNRWIDRKVIRAQPAPVAS